MIASWSGSGHDCHDSYARTNVSWAGGKDLLSGIYAHSNWPTEDSRYLYAFEEFNVRDIGVYDVSNPASPTQVTTFQ